MFSVNCEIVLPLENLDFLLSNSFHRLFLSQIQISYKFFKVHTNFMDTQYKQRAKRRVFHVGDKALLLLPTDANKLLMQCGGPYTDISRYQEEINHRLQISR